MIKHISSFLLVYIFSCLITDSTSANDSPTFKNFKSSLKRDACNNINWATWSSFTGMSSLGTINNGGDMVNVTMTSNFNFSSTPQIYNHSKFATYPSIIPNATIPQTTWSKGTGGTTEMCFSKTVTNPVLLIASLGSSSGISAKLSFSKPYVVLFDGGNMQFHDSNSLTGTEGYAIIMFPGDFTCVTINSNTEEFYTNITWGIRPPPFAINFTENKSCNTTEVTASGGVSYSWNGGDTPNNAKNKFHTSGTYLITVTDANGCKTSASKEIIVGSITPTITGNNTGCQSVTLTASGGDSYLWDGGDNPTAATNTFHTSGIYSVKVSIGTTCSSTVNKTITVSDPLTATVSFSKLPATPTCEGTAVTFTASETNGGIAPIFNWYKNGIAVATGKTYVTTDLKNNDEMRCELTSSVACIISSKVNSNSLKISVKDKPIINFTETKSCNAIELTASGGLLYSWNGGDTPTSATNKFHTSGIYVVTVTNADGCKNSASKEITVDNSILPTISGNDTQCESITLTASGGDIYLWDGGDNQNSATNTFHSSGTYSVKISIIGGCSSTITKTITILDPVTPIVTFTTLTAAPICEGTSVSFIATETNGGLTPIYTWYNNGLAVATGKTYNTTNLKNNDEIMCELTSSTACAIPSKVKSSSLKVIVNEKPTVKFEEVYYVENGKPIELNPSITGSVQSYAWTPSTGLNNASIRNPTANPSTPTRYRLKVTSVTGCEAEATVNVFLLRVFSFQMYFHLMVMKKMMAG